jgi:quercetin dioxygenase-like cupin family protein
MNTKSAKFIISSDLPWEDVGGGLSRQMMGYDGQLMLVKVKFSKGSIGILHEHFHSQSSFVVSGVFEVSIGGEKKILKAGDGFYLEPDILHGAVCLEEGILIDTFSPMRLDFIKQ